MGGRACWIIICSGRASGAVGSLQSVALRNAPTVNVSDDGLTATIQYFKNVDLQASLLADEIAGIGHTPQPTKLGLSVPDRLIFWGDRARQALVGMAEVSRYRLEDPDDPLPDLLADRVIDMLEKTEDEAVSMVRAHFGGG